MPNWSTLTLAELRQASKADIITNVGNWLNTQTKKQIIELLMDATEFADKPTVTAGEHGITSRTQTVRDALGDVARVEKTTNSYYENGVIDEITTVVENASEDVIEDKRIKHYTDKQPEGHFVLTVVLAPQDVSGITAPMHGEYWKLVDVGEDASLWAVDAPASVLLALHEELWDMSPVGTFGVLAVASARSSVFLPAAVRHHAGMSGAEALARRDKIADYLDGLGKNTEVLRAATTEHEQVVGIVDALGSTMTALWSALVQ